MTDTTPPTVTTVTPSGTGAAISGNVVITFDEPMNTTPGTVQLNSLTALSSGSWSDGNTKFTIPYSGLANSTSYTVNISGFKDAANNTMAADSTHSFTTVAAAHIHDFGTSWVSDGTNHWHECSCGEKDSVAAHTYGSWIVDTAATHTTVGSQHRDCTVCGYSVTDTIPAIGHTFGTAWVSDGTNHWHECSCGEKDSVAAHTLSDWIVDVAATATTDGSRHKECTVCGYKTPTEIISATGTPSGSDPQTPPTLSNPGNTLVADGDKYIEKNSDGSSIGEWTWDNNKDSWVFNKYVSDDPVTTVSNSKWWLWLLLAGAALALCGITFGVYKAKSKKIS